MDEVTAYFLLNEVLKSSSENFQGEGIFVSKYNQGGRDPRRRDQEIEVAPSREESVSQSLAFIVIRKAISRELSETKEELVKGRSRIRTDECDKNFRQQ